MQPLYEHQKKVLLEDKHRCGLFLGTGAAKTRTALCLAEGKTLVVCPKQQREDKKLYIFSHISVGICNTSKRE